MRSCSDCEDENDSNQLSQINIIILNPINRQFENHVYLIVALQVRKEHKITIFQLSRLKISTIEQELREQNFTLHTYKSTVSFI